MKLSVQQATLYPLTLDAEIEVLAQNGVTGIGLLAPKIPIGEEEGHSARLQAAGLRVTDCVPRTPSFFRIEFFGGTEDPDRRMREFCDDLDRLAVYEPLVCVCLPGPLGQREPSEALKVVADGFAQIAEHGERLGITIGLEPIHPDMGEAFSFINDLDSAAELLHEVDHPNLRLMLDNWHLGDSETTHDAIRRHADLLAPAIHLSDRRSPTRSWYDRVLPGEGTLDVVGFFTTLRDAGWDGWLDLEILSDNGMIEQRLNDSLWDEDPADMIKRGLNGIDRLWQAAAPQSV